MDTIEITTSEKRIPIIRDGAQVGGLAFDPQDVIFAENLYRLIGDFENKRNGYQARFESVKDDTGAGLALIREILTDIRSQIDGVFGPGTSQMVFGNSYKFEVFSQFFTAILPFFQTARAEKVAKYAKSAKSKALK